MKIKRQLLLLFLGLIFSSGHSQKIIRLAKQGNVSQSNYIVEIPFKYENKHIFIDVSIDGKVYNFLFDTGNDICVLDIQHIENLEYKKVVKKSISGSSFKKHKVQFVEITRMRISDIDFTKIGASLMDLSFINKGYSCFEKPIAGIIGANLLRKANWQIDYKNMKIKFSDDFLKFKITEKAAELDMFSKGWGMPYTNITIDGIEKRFILDTGSGGKITTGINFLEELTSNNIKTMYVSEIRGNELKNEKTYSDYNVFIETINIGDLKLEDQIISLERGVSSLIGNRLFENFIVTINWNDKKLYLDPVKKINKGKLVAYEILLKPNYTTNKIEIIGRYKRDSLEKKYKIGTEILKINGLNISNLSTQELCVFWKNKWQEIKQQATIEIETKEGEIIFVKEQLLPK